MQPISKGAPPPRVCELPSSLQIVYKWLCEQNHLNYIVKFSDDTAIPSLLYKDPNISYYIGVYIDCSLTWNVHVESLCSSLQQRM